MKFRTTLTCFLVLIFLNACASGDPKPLETSERFNSRESAEGQVQFAYILIWQTDDLDPSYRKFEEENNSRNRSGRMGDEKVFHQDIRGMNQYSPQINKQTKLSLEDKAAKRLKVRLQQESICPNDYNIDEIIWENKRIRLMGHCP